MEFQDRILLKVDTMTQYVIELEEMLPSSQKEYVHNLVDKRACEKTIELAIETVIDICSLIVSHYKLGAPSSEEDILTTLEMKKVLTSKTVAKVREMKGFRNIIVHRYGEVNDTKAYSFLNTELEDFEIFKKEIITFLKKTK